MSLAVTSATVETERRIDGGPWALLAVAATFAAAWVVVGIDTSLGVVGVAIEAVFFVFFLRHLAFAISAMATAPVDLAAPLVDTGFRPAVTVLVACKNEAAVVDGLVTSLLALDYPSDRLQLVLVDDGSDDETPTRLAAHASANGGRLEWFRRDPGAGGGKSGALNAALDRATGDIIIVFDADHRPRRDVVLRLVRHFQDAAVGAVQGRCVIRNAHDTPLTRLVAIDYLAGYLVNQYGRQSLFRLPAYGGANCAVRAASLRGLGGWNPESVTEDTDLTMRLILAGERVRYDVTAVDEEEGVVSLRRYWRQRYRWARGHQKVWRDYRGAVLRSTRLGKAERLETMLFLLVYHLPVVSALGLGILGAWVGGLATPVQPSGVYVLWTLLFLGPLMELGSALIIARAPRREAFALIFFLPVFFVSIALCTKAWVDGALGRQYQWVKTERRTNDEALVVA